MHSTALVDAFPLNNKGYVVTITIKRVVKAMDTGVYVALSKQVGNFRDLEVTANNIANTDTTGFQQEDVLFADYLAPGTAKEGTVSFANDYATFRDTSQGSLQITQGPLDVAIEGKGYFVVQTPLGIRYTRNGNFKTNGSGALVTSEGYVVLDETHQPVFFEEADRNVKIHDDGTINVDDTDRAKLAIVQFDNEQVLERLGNSLYRSDVTPKPAVNFTVVSGALERSNVNSFTALTHMLGLTRITSDTQNLITTLYTLERKASDTLAKVYS